MGLNKVQLIGNLTANAELRYTQTAKAVTTMRLACNERFYSNDQRQERVEFVTCVLWGPRGEALVQKECLLKGQALYIEGSLRTRKWVDQNQVTRYQTEVVVGRDDSALQLLSRKTGSQTVPEETPPVNETEDFSD